MIETPSQNEFFQDYISVKGPHPNPLPTAGAVPGEGTIIEGFNDKLHFPKKWSS
jgi:hypothetical protein